MDESEQPPNATDTEGMSLLNTYQDALEKGDLQSVESAAMNFFLHACAEVEKKPSPSLCLKEQAAHYEALGEWGNVETTYRQVLALPEVQKEPARLFLPTPSWAAFSDLSGNPTML